MSVLSDVRRASSVQAIGAAVGIVAIAAIYLLRINRAAGLMVDDAYYVMLGRALAEGSGYRLINSATVQMLPLYPPGFPFLLSLVFRAAPDFPENVPLLKAVSVIALLVTTLLTYVYLRRRQVTPLLSATAAAGVAIMPAFVFLATSTLMSECVFALVQLSAVVVLDRTADSSRARTKWLIVAGAVLAAAAVLIRSAGMGLAIAATLWFVGRREWSRAVLFATAVALCLLPWMTYARLHAPTTEQRHQHGGAVVYSYQEQVWMQWAGSPRSGTATFVDLPARVATNLTDVFGRGFIGIFAPALLRGPVESGEEVVSLGGRVGIRMGSMGNTAPTFVISLVFGAVILLGYVLSVRNRVTVAEVLVPVALAIILIWPFWSFRFLLPLTPYFFFYFITGIRSDAIARVALMCLIGLNLADHGRYVAAGRVEGQELRIWLREAEEVDAALGWMKQHAGSGIVATTNPALVHLRTGLKTISFDGTVEELSERRDVAIQYVACLVRQQPPHSPDFQVVYRSPSGFWVARVHHSTY